MHYHEVTASVTTCMPVVPIWFLKITNEESSLLPVLALRTRLIHRYQSAMPAGKAPHHSDLLKNGWSFMETSIVTEPLILQERDFIPVTRWIDGRFFDRVPTPEERDAFVKGYCKAKRTFISEELTIPEDFPKCEQLCLEELRTERNRSSDSDNAKKLFRILMYFPDATLQQMAKLIGSDGAWIEKIFKFNKYIDPNLIIPIRTGVISLSNAYILMKLPLAEQAAWVEAAQTMPLQEFAPSVNFRAKELRDAKRQGKEATRKVDS